MQANVHACMCRCGIQFVPISGVPGNLCQFSPSELRWRWQCEITLTDAANYTIQASRLSTRSIFHYLPLQLVWHRWCTITSVSLSCIRRWSSYSQNFRHRDNPAGPHTLHDCYYARCTLVDDWSMGWSVNDTAHRRADICLIQAFSTASNLSTSILSKLWTFLLNCIYI